MRITFPLYNWYMEPKLGSCLLGRKQYRSFLVGKLVTQVSWFGNIIARVQLRRYSTSRFFVRFNFFYEIQFHLVIFLFDSCFGVSIMAESLNFMQPAIHKFNRFYKHWTMLMENLLRSMEYWRLIENGVTISFS